jgi:hypothetical protein
LRRGKIRAELAAVGRLDLDPLPCHVLSPGDGFCLLRRGASNGETSRSFTACRRAMSNRGLFRSGLDRTMQPLPFRQLKTGGAMSFISRDLAAVRVPMRSHAGDVPE